MSTEFVSNNGNNQYSLRPERVLTSLDPELQNAVLLHQESRPLPRYLRERLTSGEEVVDVIAKLRNPQLHVEGLHIYQRIGQIVTGTVEAKNIVTVRKNENVLSLKGARRILPTLANSVPEIRATPQQLRNAFIDRNGDLDGTKVIVGIIDNGCDFGHKNFRTASGDTRILFLWDQLGGTFRDRPEGFGRSPKGYNYGREFCAAALNKALYETRLEDDPEAPLRLINYKITSDHGTEIMDIAAGNGGGKNPPGVAPQADIIFVDSSIGEDAPSDASLGNSRHLLEAVKYVFDKADELKRPAVVNISLNYDGGPHDGSTPVEEGFDRLLETPGRAIVIAAGNSRMSKIHVRRMVHPYQPCTLLWRIPENDQTDNKMEIWYSRQQRLEVTLTPPSQKTPLGPVSPRSTSTILKLGKETGRIFNRVHDSANGDNHIALILDAGVEAGDWKVTVRSLFPQPFPIHAWIESSETGGSKFPDALPSDSAYTLGTIACGLSTIVASGYNALDPSLILEKFAEGPTRDGKQKPEVSAPGHGLSAALFLTNDEVDSDLEGTSLAAPHVTGLIALLMQVAQRPLAIDETRSLVMDVARRRPPSCDDSWNPRYGFGRVDGFASVKKLLEKQAAQVVVVAEHYEVIVANPILLPDSEAPPSVSPGLDSTVVIETETVTVLTSALSNLSPTNAAVASPHETEDPQAAPPDTTGH